jgi:hypothetical protein
MRGQIWQGEIAGIKPNLAESLLFWEWNQNHQSHAAVNTVSLLYRHSLDRALPRGFNDLLGFHRLDYHQVLTGLHNVICGDVDSNHHSWNRTHNVVAGGLSGPL